MSTSDKWHIAGGRATSRSGLLEDCRRRSKFESLIYPLKNVRPKFIAFFVFPIQKHWGNANLRRPFYLCKDHSLFTPQGVNKRSLSVYILKWHILDLKYATLCFIICVAVHYQSHHGILLLSSVCLTEWSPKPPSSKQIWNRINGRMHDLYSELGSAGPLTCPQHGQVGGSLTVLIHHFHPLSNADNGRSSCDSLPPTVVIR